MQTYQEIDNPVIDAQQADSICRAVSDDFSLDNTYRACQLSMTASENYPSRFVRLSSGALQGAFYELAPPYPMAPGEWHFPDSGAFASLVAKLVERGCRSFQAQTFDWRPNGGATAELAVLLASCSRGQAAVHFAHRDGGHFSLEEMGQKAGIEMLHLPIHQRSLLVDVDRLAAMVRAHPQVRLVILDQSFKLRWQPLQQIRAALPEHVCLAYDGSHDGGLIAGGALPQPLACGADILVGNSHKTIPGPQKGFIAFADARHPLLRPVSDWVCPNLQSNSHAEQLAPFYFALAELALFGRAYAAQTVKNAKALALCLHAEGMQVVGESFGYTDTHQVHVVIGTPEEALALAVSDLAAAGIRCNNIEVPGAQGLHGLRLGVQALTRRGMVEIDMAVVARFIARIVLRGEPAEGVQQEVARFLQRFPLFPLHFSLDAHFAEPHGLALRQAVQA